jgi:hypothetical protein
MFYESIGPLLERAAEVLVGDVRGHVADDFARAQLDAVAAIVSDVGAMWPALPRGLEEETRILEGAVTADADHSDEPDPLRRHLAAVASLNDEIDRVHRRGTGGAARGRELRAAIRLAAEAQRRVMDASPATVVEGKERRI